MFKILFLSDAARARHGLGPFAAERERYLRFCAERGCTRATLRLRSAYLLWFATRMSHVDRYGIDTVRLHDIVHGARLPSPAAAETVAKFARLWLKFLGWWREEREPIPFEQQLGRFVA